MFPSSFNEFYKPILSSFWPVILSELGDKTFFIAALMSMRFSRGWVFLGSIFSLLLMTVLACCFGMAIPKLISQKWTLLFSTILFFIFAFLIFWETLKKKKDGQEEKQVENQINELKKKFLKENKTDLEIKIEKEEELGKAKLLEFDKCEDINALEINSEVETFQKKKVLLSSRQIFFQTFLMITLAEWGDKSQITTVLLAANQNPILVGLGAFLAYILCCCLAVFVGRILSKYISENILNIFAAILFLGFGIVSLIEFILFDK